MGDGRAPSRAHPNLHRPAPAKSSIVGVIIGVAVVALLVLVGLGAFATLYLQGDDGAPAKPAAPAAAPTKAKAPKAGNK